MTLNAYLNKFEPCDVLERLGHFNSIIPSLACILTKQHGVRGGKFLLKTPGNAISETINFKMSLDASALKSLCLWCEFQSHLLFIISLLLKSVLTALLFRSCLFKCCRTACKLTSVYRNFSTAYLSGSLGRIEHLNSKNIFLLKIFFKYVCTYIVLFYCRAKIIPDSHIRA